MCTVNIREQEAIKSKIVTYYVPYCRSEARYNMRAARNSLPQLICILRTKVVLNLNQTMKVDYQQPRFSLILLQYVDLASWFKYTLFTSCCERMHDFLGLEIYL